LTTEGFALEKITPAAGAAPADIPSQHSLLRTTPDPLTADEGRPDPFADHPVLGPQFHGAGALGSGHGPTAGAQHGSL